MFRQKILKNFFDSLHKIGEKRILHFAGGEKLLERIKKLTILANDESKNPEFREKAEQERIIAIKKAKDLGLEVGEETMTSGPNKADELLEGGMTEEKFARLTLEEQYFEALESRHIVALANKAAEYPNGKTNLINVFEYSIILLDDAAAEALLKLYSTEDELIKLVESITLGESMNAMINASKDSDEKLDTIFQNIELTLLPLLSTEALNTLLTDRDFDEMQDDMKIILLKSKLDEETKEQLASELIEKLDKIKGEELNTIIDYYVKKDKTVEIAAVMFDNSKTFKNVVSHKLNLAEDFEVKNKEIRFTTTNDDGTESKRSFLVAPETYTSENIEFLSSLLAAKSGEEVQKACYSRLLEISSASEDAYREYVENYDASNEYMKNFVSGLEAPAAEEAVEAAPDATEALGPIGKEIYAALNELPVELRKGARLIPGDENLKLQIDGLPEITFIKRGEALFATYENSIERQNKLGKTVDNKAILTNEIPTIPLDRSNLGEDLENLLYGLDPEYLKTKAFEKPSETLALQVEDSQDRYRQLMHAANNEFPVTYPPEPIRSMGYDDLLKNMENIRGTKALVEKLTNHGVKNPTVVLAEIIYSRSLDNYFNLEHVFDELHKAGALKSKENDAEDFAEALYKKTTKTYEADQYDFNLCLDIFEGLRDAQLETGMEEDEVIEDLELPLEMRERQVKIFKGLTKFCNFNESDLGTWEQFIGWLGDVEYAEGNITMETMDGTAYFDEGVFRRHNSPDAAYKSILTSKETYVLERGQEIYNSLAVTNRINQLIIKGLAQDVLTKTKAANITEVLSSPEFAERKASVQLENITELDGIPADKLKEMMNLFQLGYIIEQESKIDFETKEAEDQFFTENGEDLRLTNPTKAAVIGAFLKQGVPLEILEEVKNVLTAAAGMEFTVTDGEWAISGGGGGITYPLPGGHSLAFGVYGNEQGVTAGAGVSINIIKGDIVKWGADFGFATHGVGFGSSLAVGNDDVEGVARVGLGWKWGDLTPTVGGQLGIAIKEQGAIKRGIERERGKTDYAELWKDWGKTGDTEEKIKLIYQDIENEDGTTQLKYPNIVEMVKQMENELDLSKEDIVHALDGLKEKINADVLENEWAPIPIVSFLGIGMVGPVPVPHVAIRIGSTEVFVPNRRIIGRIQSVRKLRHQSEDSDLIDAIQKMKENPSVVVFKEIIGEVIYGADGQPLVVVDEETVNLSSWADTMLGYNTELAKVEMGITKLEDGKTKLKVNATKHKDVELYIDPLLDDLAIIKDGNSFIIEGDIEGLVITRERTKLPYKLNPSSSEIRDVITVRSTKSFRGVRDRAWMMSREDGRYLEKDEGKAWNVRAIGENGAQNNILEYEGYSELNTDELARKVENKEGGLLGRDHMVNEYSKHRTELVSQYTEEETEMAKDSIDRRNRAVQSVNNKAALEALPIAPDLYQKLDTLFENEEFMMVFEQIVDQPDAIISAISDFQDRGGITSLNEKELNLAGTYLLTRYFTQIYEDIENIEEANAKIAATLRKRRDSVYKHVLTNQFTAALDRLGRPTDKADEYAEQVLGDTFDKLLYELENTPDFNFKETLITEIPDGASFTSASRVYLEDKEYVPAALTHFKGIESNLFGEDLIHELGLLEITEKDYGVSSEIGQVILEALSPIPKDDLEFLYSPLARKVGAIDALYLVMDPGNFDKVTEIFENPSAEIIRKNKFALNEFRLIVKDIREAQISGKTIEWPVPNKDLIVRIGTETELMAGSYTKCANSSFYCTEKLMIDVVSKEGGIITSYTESHEAVDATQGRRSASVGLFASIRTETSSSEPEPEKEPEEGPSRTVAAEPDLPPEQQPSAPRVTSEPSTTAAGETVTIVVEDAKGGSAGSPF